MSYISVIGGGGTGIMMAADLTLKGHEVTLCDLEKYGENLTAIKSRGYVELTGNAAQGRAEISAVTFDIAEAAAQAEYILIAVMAQRQEEMIQALAPYVKDGQVICFSAGNCASIQMKEAVQDRKALVGEMQGNIYPCRLREDGSVISAFAYKEKAVAAFPAKDNAAFVERLNKIYPCHAVQNVFQAALNSPNVSIHLAATLLGTSKLETMEDFRLYRDGLSPSVLRLIEVLEEEKDAVMSCMGYDMSRAAGQIKALMEYEEHPELEIFRGLAGPDSVSHRYVTEDAYTGNSLLLSLAREFQIHTPVLESLIVIASALNGTDFYAEGRTLANMGLAGLTAEQINAYLEKGVKEGL